QVFNDPVHGHIELHPLMVKFIDTPQFQRLRYIKQLGGYLVAVTMYSLGHHTIGLNTPLGHGPFSHLFDGKFIPKVLPESKWKHEVASEMMLDHLIEENGLMEEMRKYGLDENDVIFIKELIVGPAKNADETPTTPTRHDWEYKGRPVSKSFLYEIVANKGTGVDVDKWDYFARDCHHLGIPNSFDLWRYMTFVRVIEVDMTYEDQVVHRRRQICTRNKEVNNIYEMFHTRSMLHRKAYQHKTINIIEEMITEALVAADDHLLIPGKDGEKVKMSRAIKDPVAFTRLTDQVLQQIQLSDDPNLQQAKDILAKVEKRRLYKHVGQTQAQKPLTKADGARICSEMINSLSPDDLERDGLPSLSEEDIIVLIATFDYGKKAENPIDQARFYTKENPDKAEKVCKDQVSQMLPPIFREQQIRVVCRKDDKPSLDAALNLPTLPLQLACVTDNTDSNAGISRSSTVALAYVIETERVSLELAYDRLKKSRPAIQPNPGFMSQLADFQERLEIQQ
ncbi:Deoxynucleoside triphosphate triphosphohydrolase SAMHD1, partial [Geodia barretti]